MQKPLQNKKIAILCANGVSESHMTEVQKGLMKAGAFIRTISIDHAIINSWNGTGWGVNFAVDASLNTALGVDYDMIIIPGGERSIEKLMKTPHSKRFISSLVRLNRPIGIIEDGVKLLEVTETSIDAENVILIDAHEMSVMVQHFADHSEELSVAA